MVAPDESRSALRAEPSGLPGEELLRLDSDLLHDGRFGASRLVVTEERVLREENTPGGWQTVTDVPRADLKDFKTEDLVDASALVAKQDGVRIELLRGSARRSVALSENARYLDDLAKGEPAEKPQEKTRLCPRCSRPLPEHSDVCEACVDKGQTLRRLFAYAAPYKSRLIWGTFLTFTGTVVELAPPWITRHFFDDYIGSRQASLFWPLIGSLVMVHVVTMIVQIARGRNVAFLGMKMTVAIRHSLFEKLQSLSLSFYDKRNVGSIMSRMTNDTGALYDVLVDGIPVVLNQAVKIVGIPVALLLMNFEIGLYALAPIPFILLAVRWFRKKMHRVWSRVWHQWSRMSGTLNGILQGERVVKAFRGEGREVDRFNRRIADLSRTGYEAESAWSSFFPVVLLTMALSGVVVLAVGGVAVYDKRMSLGELTAFIAYVGMLREPLMMLQRLMDWSTRALTAAERVFEVMDTPVEIDDAPDAVAMPALQGRVSFKDVHFGYDKAREVMHGVSLEVEPGEMIGLVGHSGAGKSTLINLLLRFYDPTRGSIEFDGVDVRKIQLDDFRRQVGVVLQESYLFPGSVRDNISYGRPDASLEEIVAAAKAANAHSFIVNFPDGYDSYVGERGQRLSGGERQRIAIARAILHNPKVLILDEATASVDTETERMIQEAIDNLIEGRTVFAIAHRLSTLRNANRLVVIDKGKIAEIGTHEELVTKEGGIYRKLVEMQQEVNKIRENYVEEE